MCIRHTEPATDAKCAINESDLAIFTTGAATLEGPATRTIPERDVKAKSSDRNLYLYILIFNPCQMQEKEGEKG